MKTFINLTLLSVIVLLFISSSAMADQKSQIFSTWEGFEIDKCASIWLIMNFIDKNAVIKFYPKGEPIKEGIPFDTPDAKFRRYYNMSTYESLLKHYKIKNSQLVYIGKIIHDIEVNLWERKVFQESLKVKDDVNKIIFNTKEEKEIIKKCNQYFDDFYDVISSKNM